MGWAHREVTLPHYGPDNLGGLCSECGHPMPAALPTMTMHPTCDPDWPAMAAAAHRRDRKRR